MDQSRIQRNLGDIVKKLHPGRVVEIARAAYQFRGPWEVLFMYLGFVPLQSPRLIRMRSGYNIYVETIHDLLSVWGIWARQDYPVRGDEKIIVDAGANIGAFSIYAIFRAPRAHVYAFEPVSSTFRKLEDNIRRNDLSSRITPFAYGIGKDTGHRRISVSSAGTYSSFYRKAGRKSEIVSIQSLADVLRQIGDPPVVDLLKMDCEGAEMEVLLGANRATLQRFRQILFEFHEFAGYDINEVQKKLVDTGFLPLRQTFDRKGDSGIAWFVRGKDGG